MTIETQVQSPALNQKTPQLPWVKTPLKESKPLSNAAGCQIYLKCDLDQPSGSFKSRGIGNLMLRSIINHPSPSTLHFFSSSGGNAGLACATAAKSLGFPATVVMPASTSEHMQSKVANQGATVYVHGDSWFEADEYMRTIMKEREGAVYCPPFDHEYVWEGNETILHEIKEQLEGRVPDAIVLSVGGGGLLNGVCMGMEAVGEGWEKVPILAMETRGADSLNASILAGKHLTLPRITSKAASLGCRRISDKAWEMVHKFDVRSAVLSDDEAMMGCWKLVDDERMCVEIACGVSVAPCYNGMLKMMIPELREDSLVVVVVCGGSNVTLDMLSEAKSMWMQQKVFPSYEREAVAQVDVSYAQESRL